MFRILLISQLILLAVSIERETHRLIKTHDGADIAQDVVHDKGDNTVTITVSQTPALEDLVPTVNYHDFNTKFVAFKDIEHGACLVTYAPIPFATPGVYKLGRTALTLPYTAKIQNRPMTYDDIESTAGEKIAEFCTDYTSFWMDLTPKHDSKPFRRAADELGDRVRVHHDTMRLVLQKETKSESAKCMRMRKKDTDQVRSQSNVCTFSLCEYTGKCRGERARHCKMKVVGL